ncbi:MULTISPECIES: hypothetical protein [Fischerella]|nr:MULTISPECIES: hypothetical protein [Fischerella]
MGLLPEAQQLFAKVKGVTIPLSPVNLQVSRFPQEVEVHPSDR